MRNDEFNKIEITNDKQVRGVEFGKTQKIEFTPQKDNTVPEGDLNEKYIGKTIKKKTEVNVEYMNKTPIHGSSTVVSSSTTATSAASAVATVATAASVVAVTVVAVGTGISVALHNYQYNFNDFVVTSNSLSYELFVKDLNNEKRPDDEPYEEYDEPREKDSEESNAPLKLRVYNEYYDFSIPTYLDYNWGEFNNLKPEETYNIVLSENRFGGEIIFDEQFTTLKEETRVSEFRGITWDKTCNFLTMMMNVRLDYQDDYDRFSDFKLNLKSEVVSDTAPAEISYNLSKTTEEQEIDLSSNSAFDLAQTYDYSFTYMDEGIEVTAESGTVHFEDNSGAETKFNKFIFGKTANFIDRTFEVQLDYVDDFNFYDNFVMSFFLTHEQEGMTLIDDMSVDVPLQKTNEVQTVNLDGYEVVLSESYHYKLTCLNQNVLETLDEGDVTFTDNSGAVTQFNKLIFDKKANFDTRTFEVQLDYQNDLGYLYNFELTLQDLETSNERTFTLTETTEVQTITVNEIEQGTASDPVYLIDIVEHRMAYSFKYMDRDTSVVVVEGEEFKFKNSLVSTFQGIETPYDFSGDPNYSEYPYNLPIRFLYDDAAHIYQSFAVHILLNDEDYAYLMFEGETVTHDWMYSTLMNSTDGSYDQASIIEADNVTLKVTATMLNDDAEENGGSEYIDEDVYVEDNVKFTLNDNPTVYGGRIINDNITSGDFQVSFMPIYAGKPDEYSAYLIFECEGGNTYTCQFTLPNMGNYTYVDLQLSEEGFNQDTFMSDFDSPVKISIKYCRVQTGVIPSESDYQTMVLFENYQFSISV